jgi:hypothetical protein
MRIKLLRDEGSAVLELIGFGVLLQIPILILGISLLTTQQDAFAIDSIARHTIRAQVLNQTSGSVYNLVRELTLNFELDPSLLEWEITCDPDPNCKQGPGTASIFVRYGDLRSHATYPF